MGEQGSPPYEIRERIFQFVARIVGLVRSFPRDVASREMGRQLFRSAASVGANMVEADVAESRRDFAHKASIARKEAAEVCYWLKLVEATVANTAEVGELLDEAQQITRILSAMVRKSRAALERGSQR
jgi:four helix bundle protein